MRVSEVHVASLAWLLAVLVVVFAQGCCRTMNQPPSTSATEKAQGDAAVQAPGEVRTKWRMRTPDLIFSFRLPYNKAASELSEFLDNPPKLLDELFAGRFKDIRFSTEVQIVGVSSGFLVTNDGYFVPASWSGPSYVSPDGMSGSFVSSVPPMGGTVASPIPIEYATNRAFVVLIDDEPYTAVPIFALNGDFTKKNSAVPNLSFVFGTPNFEWWGSVSKFAREPDGMTPDVQFCKSPFIERIE